MDDTGTYHETDAVAEMANTSRTEALPGFLSRRRFLIGGALGAGGLVAASALPPSMASAASPTGFQGVPQRGKSRTVVWALAAIADWNLSYDVAFNDACRFLGWTYKKVGVPIAQYSASSVVQVLNQAIQLRPDVLVTPDWVEGQGAVLEQAQKQGILVICNNANNYQDQLTSLNIPYVGPNYLEMGQKAGSALMQSLSTAGKKDGTILIGNPYPQNSNIEDRVVGATQVIDSWNHANGTDFKYVQLADNSGADPVTAISLWRAKLTQLGSAFVAGFAAADQSTQAAVKAYQGEGWHPGQYSLAAIDISTASLQQFQQGWLLDLVDEGYYYQGWWPVMIAWQTLERSFPVSGTFDSTGAALTKSQLPQEIKANQLQNSLGKAYGVTLS
jgi:ABC-type sugar transport system substrate-binding protein